MTAQVAFFGEAANVGGEERHDHDVGDGVDKHNIQATLSAVDVVLGEAVHQQGPQEDDGVGGDARNQTGIAKEIGDAAGDNERGKLDAVAAKGGLGRFVVVVAEAGQDNLVKLDGVSKYSNSREAWKRLTFVSPLPTMHCKRASAKKAQACTSLRHSTTWYVR